MAWPHLRRWGSATCAGNIRSMSKGPKQSPYPEIPGYTIEGLLSSSRIPPVDKRADEKESVISVFLAKADGESEHVALKVLPVGWTLDIFVMMRFAELRDRTLITLRAAGQFEQHGNEHHYLAMDYLGEDSLSSLLELEHLDQQRTVEIMRDVCRALSLIHSGMLQHGNVKTDNILFRPDGTAVLNFSRCFTLGQAAPDSGEKQPVDTRTDLSGLGQIFFEMLEGHPPPRSGRTIKDRRLSRPNARFQPIVDGLLVRKKNLRFSSVDEAVELLT